MNDNRIKFIISAVLIAAFSFCGCENSDSPTSDKSVSVYDSSQTAVDSENGTLLDETVDFGIKSMQPPTLYYGEKLYMHTGEEDFRIYEGDADKFDESMLDGYEYIGENTFVENFEDLKNDLDTFNIPENTKIYYNPNKLNASEGTFIMISSGGLLYPDHDLDKEPYEKIAVDYMP